MTFARCSLCAPCFARRLVGGSTASPFSRLREEVLDLLGHPVRLVDEQEVIRIVDQTNPRVRHPPLPTRQPKVFDTSLCGGIESTRTPVFSVPSILTSSPRSATSCTHRAGPSRAFAAQTLCRAESFACARTAPIPLVSISAFQPSGWSKTPRPRRLSWTDTSR